MSLLAPPAALDLPGGAEQSLLMISEDRERAVLGHGAGGWRWQVPKVGSAGPESVRDLDVCPIGSHFDVFTISPTAASQGSEPAPRRTVTSTLEDN